MTESTQPTCKERWNSHKESRCKDLRILLDASNNGEEDVDDLGNIWEYGLCFDYVPPGTFKDQDEGYWRYQISWGGPSEEFRFYSSGPHYKPYRITFVFLDWFDGHESTLYDGDKELLLDIWDLFNEIGSTEKTYEDATVNNECAY